MLKIKNVSVETFQTDWNETLKLFSKADRKWFPRKINEWEKPVIDLTFTLTDGTVFTKSYIIGTKDLYTRGNEPIILLPVEELNTLIDIYPRKINEEVITKQFNEELDRWTRILFNGVNKHNFSHEEVIDILNQSIINHLKDEVEE